MFIFRSLQFRKSAKGRVYTFINMVKLFCESLYLCFCQKPDALYQLLEDEPTQILLTILKQTYDAENSCEVQTIITSIVSQVLLIL